MTEIKVSEDFWASRMLPEGVVEEWLVADGALVQSGQTVGEIRVEDALHAIPAPTAGRIHIEAPANSVIDPGSVLGQVQP